MYSRAELEDFLVAAAGRYGIDSGIAIRQIQQESSFNPNAVSYAGAKGIAQFMPATAARFGLSNPFDPIASFEAWGKYMSWLLNRYGGNYASALAGYNAGEGNVDKYNGVPPFRETRDYVTKILGSLNPYYGGVADTSYDDDNDGPFDSSQLDQWAVSDAIALQPGFPIGAVLGVAVLVVVAVLIAR